ncbi:MAG: hypothetical protein ABIS14_12780 [Sphingomonas sp.]
MAYGDLPFGAPHKPNKGHEGGACNRERCQAEPALHYNHGSYSWYCADCARDIGQDFFNLHDWNKRWKPKCGHDQFETREQMNARSTGFGEDHSGIYGANYGDRSVKRSHRAEGRNYVD